MLEIGSDPGSQNDIQKIMNDTQDKISSLSQQAANIGLKRSYFQHLPDKTASDLLKNVMDVERYQAFFAPPRDDMQAVAAYFSVCKSNQVSVSYRDTDHMLENVRRLYTLAPFLFMTSDNAAPFNEAQAFRGHAGMHHRAALKDRGGIPPYVFTAKTGDEYIRSHVDHVMNNPLFVYYNEKGKLVRLESGKWVTFNELRDKGLNTATNYFFSESILWPDVKIAALKDNQGRVINHRYEARMFGVGLHQHQTMLLITAALAYDEALAKKVDALLLQYGFDLKAPNLLKAPLDKAYKDALNHDQKFLDIPYGKRTMAEFAKDFADLIESSDFIAGHENAIAPFLLICRTGCTDSKVNALLFDTLDKAIDFQRSYDAEIFEDPHLCARMIFEQDIQTRTGKSSYCSNT